MKFLCTFMALQIMLLSIFPCGDGEPSHSQENTSAAETIISNPCDHQHEEVPGDGCSPLCVCNCCHSPIFVSYFCFKLQYISVQAPRIAGFFIADGYSHSHNDSLLRPPQIV